MKVWLLTVSWLDQSSHKKPNWTPTSAPSPSSTSPMAWAWLSAPPASTWLTATLTTPSPGRTRLTSHRTGNSPTFVYTAGLERHIAWGVTLSRVSVFQRQDFHLEGLPCLHHDKWQHPGDGASPPRVEETSSQRWLPRRLHPQWKPVLATGPWTNRYVSQDLALELLGVSRKHYKPLVDLIVQMPVYCVYSCVYSCEVTPPLLWSFLADFCCMLCNSIFIFVRQNVQDAILLPTSTLKSMPTLFTYSGVSGPNRKFTRIKS